MKQAIGTLLLLSALTMIPQPSFADRGKDGDLMLWTELKYIHRFADTPWSLFVSTENRFDDDISQYDIFNTTLGFNYKIFDWFGAGGAFRFETDEKNLKEITGDYYKEEFRPMINLIFSKKFGDSVPLTLAARNRFEFRIFPGFDGDLDDNDTFRFRYRLRLKVGPTFKTGSIKITPWFSNEFFFQFHNKPEKFNSFDQDRIAAGATLGFKTGGLTIKYTPFYYLFRLDRNIKKNESDSWIGRHVLGTTLSFIY